MRLMGEPEHFPKGEIRPVGELPTTRNKWLMNSLKNRIAIIFSIIIILLVLIIVLLIGNDVKKEITASEVRNAQNILGQILTSVDNKYKDHIYYREALLNERKEFLKHITGVAVEAVRKLYKEYLAGKITEKEAKEQAKEILRVMRYARGSGYIWIQDTTLPVPNMIMHPSVSGLEGKTGEDPIYYKALDGRTNLLGEFVRAAEKNDNTAFVAYRWPKPTPEGLTAMQPKVSHVRIFKPWGWLIGTGVYTDDIEEACQNHFNKILDDLSVDLGRVKLGQTGYVYIFDGDFNFLIHPRLRGQNGKELRNPGTDSYILQDIIDASNKSEGKFEYLWNKPGEPENRTYLKVVYVRHFEPLDWYIGASIYRADLESKAFAIQTKILIGALLFLLLVPPLAWWVARGISQPLADLAAAAEQINPKNLSEVELPVKGTCETKSLGLALQNMIDRVSRDIAEQQRLEEQLRQSAKMQAVGNLAGGIAHDLNNMLSAILGAVEMLANESLDDNEAKEDINIIGDAATRAADLTQNLLTFSRKGKNISKPMDLHETVNDACELLERTIGQKIVLNKDFAADISTIFGDSTLIQNVLLNLGINARDAMPEGGEILIRTKNVVIDENNSSIGSLVAPGVYIELSVSDTGTGMPKDIQEHVFEPFYTTKDEGKGTGLGLTSVYRTVTDHNGEILVESEEGNGTEFKIYLPVEELEISSKTLAEEGVIFGKGCILLVDDEQIVRTTNSNLIEKLGYEVLTAEDGRHAIDIFKEHQDRIDLVLLDVVMPRMGGRETYNELRKIDPNVKVIFVSGFTRELSIEKLICDGAQAFLSKPFCRRELSLEIAKALGIGSNKSS